MNKMQLFDSHCHIDDRAYAQDRDMIIQRAFEQGVNAMMVVGITESSSKKALEIANKHNNIYASVGIHPHDARDASENVMENLIQLSKNSKVKAWGETGLDFNRMYSTKKDQEHWFERQLEIASSLKLPLIFHERDSKGRFLEILSTYSNQVQGVIHCFSGNQKELEAYINMGFYIGITGIVTISKRGKTLRQLIPQIPFNKIVIETDSPYLTPSPERNRYRRNEPAFVISVFLKLLELFKIEKEELAKQLWDNTCNLFNI